MESVWFTPTLSDEVINNKKILEHVQNIVTDILSYRIDVTQIIENLKDVLTNKDAENREKGMHFLTEILIALPDTYLSETQIKFISTFYVDRLKDNHRVLPAVLRGYLTLANKKHYNITCCPEFFTTLFKEVSCQSQVRQDRYHIYMILSTLMDKDLEYMKTLGPDFVYGVISAMDGERDPRNLMLLFTILPKFLKNIPLGHLVEEMFEVISCYYPIDFHPSPDDPAAVTRQELADALAPCLCAVPEFGEHCMVLLIEKLDSSLHVAKSDSLKLLVECCKHFKPDTFTPFLKPLWSSIHKEIFNKTDNEMKLFAHEALSALIAKLSTAANCDQSFGTMVKGVLLSMQTSIAESTTVAQFTQAAKVLLTTANASKESCLLITKMMIPATIAFYGFKSSSPKLQIASLNYLADLYELAAHWNLLDAIDEQAKEIHQQCLIAVSHPSKEYQIAGFRTFIRVIDVLDTELVVPFVEVLIHNIHHSNDNDVLSVSVEAIHALGRKYPKLTMQYVVKGKCDVENLLEEKNLLRKRLNLLVNLASIDDFTKIIIEEMLKLITGNDTDALNVVEILSTTMSKSSLYCDSKISQIESDHGLIDSVMMWLDKEIKNRPLDCLSHGYNLIANTIASLPADKQESMLLKHTQRIIDLTKTDKNYFLLLECFYSSVHRTYYSDKYQEVLSLALNVTLYGENEIIRAKACMVIAHFLNKADAGQKFETLYEGLKNFLSSCKRDDDSLCPRLICLYGWIVKALVLRGSDLFLFWLEKITVSLTTADFCHTGAEAIRLIMTDNPEYLSARQHCRVSLFYKQRMFQTFADLTSKLGPVAQEAKESYLLSWAYVLKEAPKGIVSSRVETIAPLVIDSLDYDNEVLLLVMMDVLSLFVETVPVSIGDSLQTILPRLIKLSRYVKSMEVRMKSLQCLYDIANDYSTIILLKYKQDILLDLTPALDDKKRFVRNLAVKARTRWFLVGAPGEKK